MSDFDKTIRGRRTVPVVASTPKRPCLTVLQGGPVGLVYTLVAGTETLIGRGGESDIPLDEPRVSRKHARIKVDTEGNAVIEDLDSSNGTFVNGVKVQRQVLKEGDRIHIAFTCVIKFSYQDELEYQLQHEIAGGVKDPLTAVYTKEHLRERIDTEFAYAQRHNGHLGVLIFAVDRFNEISLAHGQPAGDLILKEVAHLGSRVLRAGDILGRYDAERLVVLARDLDEEGSVILAQRIRKIVQEHQFELDGTPVQLTVSIGIATLADRPAKAEDLIEIAEKALSKTKKEVGENCIGGAAVAAYLENNDPALTIVYVPSEET